MTQRVAVVTGGSRGVGRGIAVALGQAGMVVVVTGRQLGESGGRTSLQGAAEAVTAAGGTGIPVPCDHRDDAQVAALFEQVGRDYGRVDVLVNNATALPRALTRPGPFWEKPVALTDVLEVGLRSHYVATHAAAPLLIAAGGLVVMTSSFGGRCYMHGPAYGAGKAGVDKMAADMAVDFQPAGVAVVSLWLGFVRTEKNEPLFSMPGIEQTPYGAFIQNYETPGFIGRVIAALHADPARATRSGQVHIAAELAEVYGITEQDGRAPRSSREALGDPPVPSAVVIR